MSDKYDQWELSPQRPEEPEQAEQFAPMSTNSVPNAAWPVAQPSDTGRSSASTRNRLLWALVVVIVIAIVALAGYLVWGVKTDRISLSGADESQQPSSSAAQTMTQTATATVTETTITQTQTQREETTVVREPTAERAATGADGYISAVQTSRGTVVPASMACDGHYVLIVQSVLGGDNLSTRQELARALEQDSRLQYATPGLCPSLRPSKDGQDVYAVYFDTDSAAEACSLKGQWGGNVRALKNEADYYSDPC